MATEAEAVNIEATNSSKDGRSETPVRRQLTLFENLPVLWLCTFVLPIRLQGLVARALSRALVNTHRCAVSVIDKLPCSLG